MPTRYRRHADAMPLGIFVVNQWLADDSPQSVSRPRPGCREWRKKIPAQRIVRGHSLAMAARSVAVHPVLDQLVDNAGVGQCRGVAKAAIVVLGNLAQDTAHDLARTGLGQTRGPLDEVRRGD